MEKKVVITQMKTRSGSISTKPPSSHKRKYAHKRLSGHTKLFAVAFLCLLGCGYSIATHNPELQTVSATLTSGFEYDETLGRLQYVSSILPESAMVFLDASLSDSLVVPSNGTVTHAWNEREPGMEYANTSLVSACMDGEVMTVVRNREDEYTVRILHENGYESLYSGLAASHVAASDLVVAGQTIGESKGFSAFELRCDGTSVMPVFAAGE